MSYILNKCSHEPLLDFFKGLCIFWVIWEHSMPYQPQMLFYFWGKMAVPIFLMIQTFHVQKKGPDYKFPDIRSIFRRIISPFFVATLIIIIIKLLWHDIDILDKHVWINILKSGGIGPGSYYPWVYIQFAIMLPIVLRFIKQCPLHIQAFALIIISIFLESFFTLLGGTEYLWRLLAIRYIFIIFGGIYLCEKGICLTPLTIILSFISVLFIFLFEYKDLNLTPIFYDSDYSWRSTHWICFFYVFFLFPYLLTQLFRFLPQFVIRVFILIGKCSYEIFLTQMVFFAVVGIHHNEIVGTFVSNGLSHKLYTISFWLIIVGTGIILNKLKHKTMN